MRATALAVALGIGAGGCASFAPSVADLYVAKDAPALAASADPPAAILVGDVGWPEAGQRGLAPRIATRAGASDAPVLVLGDVFYVSGLLGFCPPDGDRSRRRCEGAGPPEAQLAAVFGEAWAPLRERRLVAIAGNHDHEGDPAATANACRLLPVHGREWRYLARGCGLDESPVAVVDAGEVAFLVLDSEPMIQDADYRERALTALEREIVALRRAHPEKWRVLAMHHPLETYGQHNGAGALGLLKDAYPLLSTVLLPITWPLVRLLAPHAGAQNPYEWSYRGFRRDVYRVLAREPVHLVAAGHDHSLQLVEIDRPGARWQVVSGSGASRTPVQRFGLDLLWTNRLARLVGLGGALPAPRHRLVFGSSGEREGARTGRGFVALVPDGDTLVLEFRDSGLDEPLFVGAIERAR